MCSQYVCFVSPRRGGIRLRTNDNLEEVSLALNGTEANGVSFEVGGSEAFGVVGESGSGKSVMARAIMGLMPASSARTGEVYFRGRDLLALSRKQLQEVWGKQIAMVFQDPGRSLNPVVRVQRQLTEGMRRHLGVSRSEAHTRALNLLKEVGVPDPERRLRRSGGRWR
jgi:peptide/nickel transport system ATP-binding protein